MTDISALENCARVVRKISNPHNFSHIDWVHPDIESGEVVDPQGTLLLVATLIPEFLLVKKVLWWGSGEFLNAPIFPVMRSFRHANF